VNIELAKNAAEIGYALSDSCDYVFTPSAHGELAAGAVLRRGFRYAL